jgi:hypothetical protein
MANRLLPFRDYDEHDVINLFALASADVNTNLTTVGKGDAGVAVKLTSTVAADDGTPANWDLNKAPVTYGADAGNYMDGSKTVPHLGSNGYPSASLEVAAASATGTDAVIGLTLRQTAKYDENGESLLRYPVKRDEYMAITPGQVVPILTKGIVMIDSKALTDSKADSSLKAGAAIHAHTNGDLSTKTTTGVRVGTVLAIGSRTKQGPSNVDVHEGTFALVKIEL